MLPVFVCVSMAYLLAASLKAPKDALNSILNFALVVDVYWCVALFSLIYLLCQVSPVQIKIQQAKKMASARQALGEAVKTTGLTPELVWQQLKRSGHLRTNESTAASLAVRNEESTFLHMLACVENSHLHYASFFKKHLFAMACRFSFRLNPLVFALYFFFHNPTLPRITPLLQPPRSSHM